MGSSGSATAILYNHRRRAGEELYFVMNTSHEPWTGTVSVAELAEAQLWDPCTGAIQDLELRFGARGTAVEVTLPPSEGRLVLGRPPSGPAQTLAPRRSPSS